MESQSKLSTAWALLLLSPLLSAQADTPPSIESELFVPALEELADWSHSERLFGRRDWVYGVLLSFEPDHKEARRRLKYRRVKGEWVQRSSYEARLDRDEHALARFAMELEELSQELHSELPAWTENCSDPTEREHIWRSLLRILPEDERAIRALSKVAWLSPSGEQLWLDSDSLDGLHRRQELRELIRPLEARPGQLTPTLPGSELPTAEELLEARADGCVQLVQDAQTLLMAALPGNAGVPADTSILLLEGRSSQRELLDEFPELSREERLVAEQGTSWWVPGTHELILWDVDPELQRRDAVLRTSGAQLSRSYGIQPDSGLVLEGVLLYVSEELLGRAHPLRASLARTPDDAPLECALRDDPPHLREALGALQELNAERLGVILGLEGSALTRRDALFASCLMRYLIEVRCDALVPVMRATGRGELDTAALEGALGCSIPELLGRLVSWQSDRVLMASAAAAPTRR